MGSMRLLAGVLVLQVVLAGTLIALVATDNVPFVSVEDARRDGEAQAAGGVPRATSRAFDSRAAYNSVKRQVALGPRPAGSQASRVLAERLRRALPGGRFQAVPGGLRNVIGVVPGKTRRVVVVGAHYDTKDLRGFVGANDGAAGTAVMVQLARSDQATHAEADAGVHRLRRRGEPGRRSGRAVRRPRAAGQQGRRRAL